MLNIFLIDGSGSMRPAWDVAWEALFRSAKESDGAFGILMFKSTLNYHDLMNLRYFSTKYPIVYEDSHLIIINIAAMIGNRLKSSIIEPPLTFSGRTPLVDAILSMIRIAERRFERTGVPYEITVISDNRDSSSFIKDDSIVIEMKRKAQGMRGLYLIPIGDLNTKYLDKYDKVLNPPREGGWT